ncbi:MAG: SPOR domain-containing protein [Bacteroidia bacterium]
MKPNYKNNTTLFIASFCALVTTVASAQTDATKQVKNQQRIDALLNKIDALEQPNVSKFRFDSVLTINTQQQLSLNEKDTEIARLKALLASSKPMLTENATTAANYIIVGAYNTKATAQKYRTVHNLSSFEIIQSKSKRWYFIAAPIAEKENAKEALKTLRSTTEAEAWQYN